MSSSETEGPREDFIKTTKSPASQTRMIKVSQDSAPLASSASNDDSKKDKKNGLNNSPNTSRYGRTIKSKLRSSTPSSYASPIFDKQEPPAEENDGGVVGKKIAEEMAKDKFDETNLRSTNNSDVISNVSKDSNSVNNLTECNWRLGQLAWARISTFPFWPCVVNLEPLTMTYTKVLTIGRSQCLGVHVQYFGDKGRHNWVTANNMIPFTGIKDFQNLAESLTPEVKKNSPKYAAAFIVKSGIRAKWERAVDEAMEVLSMSDDQRAEEFKPRLKQAKSVTPKVGKILGKEKLPRKRKLSLDHNVTAAKYAKKENVRTKMLFKPDSEAEVEEKLEKPKVRKQKQQRIDKGGDNVKVEVNLGANTPPTPPSSHKDSSDEASLPRKPKGKKSGKESAEGDFEIYFERNRDRIEDDQPDASESEIRRYLKKTWANMDNASKSIYQGRLKLNDSSQMEESSSDDEDEEDEDEDEEEEEEEEDDDEEEEEEEEREGRTFSRKKKSKSKVNSTKHSNLKKKRPFNLFKGTKQERVCQICEKTGKLTRCRGPCYSYFHLPCVKPGESSPENSMDGITTEDEMYDSSSKEAKDNFVREDNCNNQDEEETDDKNDDKSYEPVEPEEEEAFKCIDCLSGVAPACFICNEREGDRIRCSVLACGKHYHPSCLKPWPQSHWQGGRLSCPYHVCHTCSSDNPRDSHHSRIPNEKLARCVRCPSSYHPSSSCLPAGSSILTGNQIVCPKHFDAPHPPLNAAWCFLCTKGGSLICCDTCPTSFHPECLGIDAPDGAFICEDCETGRLPLYGEVTWVKLGNYRWWPSVICFPHEIPRNVDMISHSPGEFCVMFLGTNNYYWVHRGRAFLYQDGDANTKASAGKKYVNEAFKRALEEAHKMHLRLKIEKAAAKDNNSSRGLKPPPYVKLKVNKPVGNVKATEVESIAACDCDPEWDNPCAPETDCLNRILSVECSSGICPAGDKCCNQAFVRRKYPRMEPFHTAGRGWGLRSLEEIKSGQFVIEYVGEVIDEAEYKRRLQRKKELKDENFYFLTIDNFRMIDAEPKGNLSRFMNHSCQPNCETQKWTVNGDTRIGLFALKDIKSGQELTFNYNLACDGETRKPCLCGAPNCTGFIGAKTKVQKLLNNHQQLNNLNQNDIINKKIDKLDKIMKRAKRSNNKTISCWTCGKEINDLSKDNLLQCDQKTCYKMYHKSCIKIDNDRPRFSCPWHHCAVCRRRTSAHCSFCSEAYCQAHIDGKLTEHDSRGRLICQSHGPVDSDNNESENDTENEKEESPNGGVNSPILNDKPPVREPSPRVSIIEVHVSSAEEGEESQKEDEDEQTGYTANYRRINKIDSNNDNINDTTKNKISRRYSIRKQRQEETTRNLNALTSSQLQAIIGGNVNNDELII